jgi:hypothetical protein
MQNASHIPDQQSQSPLAGVLNGIPLVNLHDPAIDPTGRMDVLIARALTGLIQATGNPVLCQGILPQLQPVLDTCVHHALGRNANCRRALERLGLVEKVKAKRVRKSTRGTAGGKS